MAASTDAKDEKFVTIKGRKIEKTMLHRDPTLVPGKTVRVNGVVYETEMVNGVHRFLRKEPQEDIIAVSIAVQEGRCSTRQCAETFMNVGYSIDGWCNAVGDLIEVVLDNPKWPSVWVSRGPNGKDDEVSDCGESDDDDVSAEKTDTETISCPKCSGSGRIPNPH